MKTVNDILSEKGSWIFIVPIKGLILTEAVNREFLMSKVLFVDHQKLPYIRKRFGIPQRISELKTLKSTKEFFDSAQTFALFPHYGVAIGKRTKCLRVVRDELAILTLSQLGVRKRRFNSHPGIMCEFSRGPIDSWFINLQGKGNIFNRQMSKGFVPLHLDNEWKRVHRNSFYLKLLKIINGKTEAQKSWVNNLRTASILIGESLSSNDIANAFLLNMIALECILTKQGDQFRTDLPKRIEAFLGWAGYWHVKNYEQKIQVAYTKRCNLVHSAKRDDVKIQDLLFTDDLLFNLLTNIVDHIDRFPSKKAIMEFADKVEAEHLLGIKSKVRPKTLHFISRTYTKEDYEEI